MKRKTDNPTLLPVPDPPAHLSERARAIWRDAVAGPVKTPSQASLLLVGLEALDRGAQARMIIDKEGLIQRTERSGVSHAHPAVKIEKESLALAAKVFISIGMTVPPGPFGTEPCWSRS